LLGGWQRSDSTIVPESAVPLKITSACVPPSPARGHSPLGTGPTCCCAADIEQAHAASRAAKYQEENALAVDQLGIVRAGHKRNRQAGASRAWPAASASE